jgi:hypothetical protein
LYSTNGTCSIDGKRRFATERDDWSSFLSDLRAIRTMERATYHCISPDQAGVACGVSAYRPTSAAAFPSRVGLSYARLPGAPGVLPYELGHNKGRRHCPCRDLPGADLDFPHTNARIGPPGYNHSTRQIVDPDQRADHIWYCGPR